MLVSRSPILITLLSALAAAAQSAPVPRPPVLDGAAIAGAAGGNPESGPSGAVKVSFPRTDPAMRVDGVALPPFLGLTSWAAFQPFAGGGAMVMGDLVLLEDEVNPAMSAALDCGLEVTALHNHFFYDEPHVYFMHIGGHGEPVALAHGVRAALDAAAAVRKRSPAPARGFGGASISTKNAISGIPLESLLGAKGTAKDGMFKAVMGRSAAMGGESFGKFMGVNTWAAFAGDDAHAVVDGDFAVAEDELQPVLKALRAGGINIVAIHSHMTGEQPRILFLHYWGKGPAAALAKTIRTALDRTRWDGAGAKP